MNNIYTTVHIYENNNNNIMYYCTVCTVYTSMYIIYCIVYSIVYCIIKFLLTNNKFKLKFYDFYMQT